MSLAEVWTQRDLRDLPRRGWVVVGVVVTGYERFS